MTIRTGFWISLTCSFISLALSIFFTVQEENNMKPNLGKTVVIAKDTLIIVDYSTLLNSYELSNGTQISTEFFEKLK